MAVVIANVTYLFGGHHIQCKNICKNVLGLFVYSNICKYTVFKPVKRISDAIFSSLKPYFNLYVYTDQSTESTCTESRLRQNETLCLFFEWRVNQHTMYLLFW